MLSQTILHIGLDKTGSTAIQLACLNNKRLLLENSILYPLFDFSHGQLGSCFYENPVEYIHNVELARTDRKQIELEDEHYLRNLMLEIEGSTAKTMILSSEAFSYMDAPSVSRLQHFLAAISERVQVILYCRPPLSYAVSALSQRARTGMPLWSEPPVQEIRKICHAYEEAFGHENITARTFVRESLPDGDVRLDFFSFVGLLPEYVKRSMRLGGERDNSTLSAEAILIAEALRKIHSDQPLANIEFSLKYEPLLRTIRGGAIRLTQQQVAEVRSASSEHIDYAARILNLALDEPDLQYEGMLPSFGPDALDSIAQLFRRLVELDPERSNIVQDITSSDLIVREAKLVGGADVEYGNAISFEIDILITRALENLELGIHIFDAEHRWAFGTNTRLLGHQFTNVDAGAYHVMHHLIANLPIGSYSAGFAFTERFPAGEKQLAWFDSVCQFRVGRSEDQVFAGYAYLPAEISLLRKLGAPENSVVSDVAGSLNVFNVPKMPSLGQSFTASLDICNDSKQHWLGDPYRPINIVYRWLDSLTRQTVVEGEHMLLPNGGVSSGARLHTEIQIIAPADPGPYTLMLTLVQKHVGWFEEMGVGFQPALFDVVVQKIGDVAIPHSSGREIISSVSTVFDPTDSTRTAPIVSDTLCLSSNNSVKARKK